MTGLEIGLPGELEGKKMIIWFGNEPMQSNQDS
jgi:hypothetical protein